LALFTLEISHLKLSADPETKALLLANWVPGSSTPVELLNIIPSPKVSKVNGSGLTAEAVIFVEVARVKSPDTTLLTKAVEPPWLKKLRTAIC